jgi:hypothetical protein
MTEDRPRIDRIAEKILGVIGFIVGAGIAIFGLAIVVSSLNVPMFAATAPLFLGVVVIIGGVLIIWAIWRHFSKKRFWVTLNQQCVNIVSKGHRVLKLNHLQCDQP